MDQEDIPGPGVGTVGPCRVGASLLCSAFAGEGPYQVETATVNVFWQEFLQRGRGEKNTKAASGVEGKPLQPS
jgi:hypothetical protein